MNLRHLPNIITGLRLLLVPPLAIFLLEQRFGTALTVMAVAGVSDFLDGFLARRYGWTSRLGGLMDPLADKLLLVTCFAVLGVLELLPFWLVILVVVRDAVIVAGALSYQLLFGALELAPTLLSKLNTVLQVILVIATVSVAYGLELPSIVIAALIALTAMTTGLSGVHYVWSWSRRAVDAARARA